MSESNANYAINFDREYIRYALESRFHGVSDDQCDTIAQYLEDNLFDLINDAADETISDEFDFDGNPIEEEEE